ncbi:MAG: hypothetical protein KJ626_01305 [Verrucomicrobia bacterium]|nr:hypothetical protein [Verrucomicrobiota bacterium]
MNISIMGRSYGTDVIARSENDAAIQILQARVTFYADPALPELDCPAKRGVNFVTSFLATIKHSSTKQMNW